MKQTITRFALEHSRTVYAVVLLVTLACMAMIPFLTIDTDPENMLREDDPARVFHNRVKQQFTMHDMIVVGAVNNSEQGIYNPTSLQALHQLSKGILELDGIVRSDQMSLDTVDNITQEGPGVIRFEWLMQDAPTTQQQSEQLRDAVNRLPMLANTLVSGDGKAAAIYVPVESKDESYRIAEEIRGIISSLQSQDDFHITGLPVAEDQFGVEMFIQMGISAPLAGLAIFMLMWMFFRSIPLVVGPMVVAMATVLITMGLLIGMGFTVHIMSSMIAIFLMPIAVVDSTHILSEFADRFRPGEDPKKVIIKVLDHLFTPMLYTTITSAIGFLSLMLTPIPPVRIFGAFIGFGIFLAFVLTIVYIPAYISRMKPESLESMQDAIHRLEGGGRLGRWLPKVGRMATGGRYAVLLVSLTLFAVSVVGITKIQINDNPVNWFKADHEIRVADRVLNDHFAGTYDAWLVLERPSGSASSKAFVDQYNKVISEAGKQGIDLIPLQITDETNLYEMATAIDDRLFSSSGLLEAGDEEIVWLEELLVLVEVQLEQSRVFQSPEVLSWISDLQDYLLSSDLVGKVNALPDVVRTVNRELQSGNDKDFRLPVTANGVAQALLQYQSSHRPQDLWHFVTPDYTSSLVWLQLTSGDNQHMTQVVELVDNYIARNPLPAGLEYGWAGKAYLNVIWQDAMVSGMVDSLLSSFAVVFVMMVLLFRSVKFGLLAMLPLTFTITFIYGLIGWIGKDYDMPIAVLSALTLGLSVDFAIHFLQRYRELRKEKENEVALAEMFEEPGRAITRNAIVIAVGFTPLLFAPLVPYITVGIFLASIMAASALVTLLLLPAILSSRVSGQVSGQALRSAS
ncbi:MMPL family transporter [Sansalvadorimonas sp. 2012CJ34-2]|uniref:MMPL family transporter n=1 Tax=Parendozoicomonas callyspongiae TaxID=2942213 RepID=A0ABT0PGE5_9GAMM|nr:MMPL family transporter [Sansalvadorimonas sp. 2012CJ34-2]MCL6269578.1 MMPL family transporter [Sansalvadorimonas sp. 2012CJ34-2]